MDFAFGVVFLSTYVLPSITKVILLGVYGITCLSLRKYIISLVLHPPGAWVLVLGCANCGIPTMRVCGKIKLFQVINIPQLISPTMHEVERFYPSKCLPDDISLVRNLFLTIDMHSVHLSTKASQSDRSFNLSRNIIYRFSASLGLMEREIVEVPTADQLEFFVYAASNPRISKDHQKRNCASQCSRILRVVTVYDAMQE
ncbi:hypothetical protein BDN70DRAFT_367018 [Pholiota conissans]|uniref:Uncharacterized protein n=1 Tax=Pholiota conissans TaxID=109636 RepID=A0A9P6D066_9AGAR|nr:hypothetical protein BDN70DRAFT_367018 [Pholiota conissans]